MDLKSFKPRRETVVVPTEGGDQILTVYGLEFQDISFLVGEYGDLLTGLYEMIVSPVAPANIEAVLGKAIVSAPLLIASVVAFGARQPEAIPEVARHMPPAIQLEAVEKIVRLTIVGEHGLKKATEVVRMALAAMPTQSHSETGS